MDRILRIPEIVEITGLSRTTIWRRVKSGDFPAPVRLGSLATRSVGWRESEIKQWLDSRPGAAGDSRLDRGIQMLGRAGI